MESITEFSWLFSWICFQFPQKDDKRHEQVLAAYLLEILSSSPHGNYIVNTMFLKKTLRLRAELGVWRFGKRRLREECQIAKARFYIVAEIHKSKVHTAATLDGSVLGSVIYLESSKFGFDLESIFGIADDEWLISQNSGDSLHNTTTTIAICAADAILKICPYLKTPQQESL